MKTKYEINERIRNLKSSERNGCDNRIEIEILESSLSLSEKQIKSAIKNQLENGKYKEVRIGLWLLENEINPGF